VDESNVNPMQAVEKRPCLPAPVPHYW